MLYTYLAIIWQYIYLFPTFIPIDHNIHTCVFGRARRYVKIIFFKIYINMYNWALQTMRFCCSANLYTYTHSFWVGFYFCVWCAIQRNLFASLAFIGIPFWLIMYLGTCCKQKPDQNTKIHTFTRVCYGQIYWIRRIPMWGFLLTPHSRLREYFKCMFIISNTVQIEFFLNKLKAIYVL